MGTTTDLELEFHEDMFRAHKELVKYHRYSATRFLGMVKRYGGVGAAKKALEGETLRPGLIELATRGALDYSVEPYVLQDRYQHLFTPAERRKAKQRLYDLGYFKDEQP
jgi:hypothetical protein